MQTNNKIFEDAAKVAGGVVGTLAGIKREIEALVRQQAERILANMDFVSRDEFEAVREMAAKARAEQEALERRLAELEAALAGKTRAGAARKGGAAKPRSRKA